MLNSLFAGDSFMHKQVYLFSWISKEEIFDCSDKQRFSKFLLHIFDSFSKKKEHYSFVFCDYRMDYTNQHSSFLELADQNV